MMDAETTIEEMIIEMLDCCLARGGICSGHMTSFDRFALKLRTH